MEFFNLTFDPFTRNIIVSSFTTYISIFSIYCNVSPRRLYNLNFGVTLQQFWNYLQRRQITISLL